jgi:hypothetical protein
MGSCIGKSRAGHWMDEGIGNILQMLTHNSRYSYCRLLPSPPLRQVTARLMTDISAASVRILRYVVRRYGPWLCFTPAVLFLPCPLHREFRVLISPGRPVMHTQGIQGDGDGISARVSGTKLLIDSRSAIVRSHSTRCSS